MKIFHLGIFIAGCIVPATLLYPLNAQTVKQAAQDANATTSSDAPTPTSAHSTSTSGAKNSTSSTLHSTSAASPATATPAGQVPDDITQKLAALIHAGKYADAQQLTVGLLLAYPTDQRLIKAKGLLDQLLASSSGNTSQPASNAPAQPSSTPTEQLTGMDKLDYDSLIELAREAQQTTDLEQQSTLLYQFMVKSDPFLKKHPDQMLLWQIRAATALSQNYPLAGYAAGQKLLAAGAENSSDPNVRHLMAQLNLKGWMDHQQAEAQQWQVEADRKQQAENAEAQRQQAESSKYTFPVFHVHGIRYAYGHLTINEDEAIYVGTDETDHIARSDMREVKVACSAVACGMYFTPNRGRRFFFVAVTEEAVEAQSDKGRPYLNPAVLGNAVVARWKFVSKDKKTLVPSDEGSSRSKF